MKVVFLVESREDPSTKHRAVDLFEPLSDRGIEPSLAVLPRGWFARRTLFRTLGSADAVVLQRRLMSPVDLRALRRRVSRLIFDFDDALPYRDSSRGAMLSRTRCRRFRAAVSRSDLVIAGNSWLAELARRFGAANPRVLPTGLRIHDYVEREGVRKSDPTDPAYRLGWIGSSSTLPYLENLGDSLARVAARCPGTVLSVMCDRPPRIDGIRIEFSPWSPDREVSFLHSLDVGLAPLCDDEWSRGKCGLRLLKYCACGIPSVASAVGVQSEWFDTAAFGRLVRRPSEWESELFGMSEDRGSWVRMARQGRAFAESFDVSRLSHDLAHMLSGAAFTGA